MVFSAAPSCRARVTLALQPTKTQNNNLEKIRLFGKPCGLPTFRTMPIRKTANPHIKPAPPFFRKASTLKDFKPLMRGDAAAPTKRKATRPAT